MRARVAMVRWVGQEEPWGCGCAAVAMLTGRTYAAIRAHTGRSFGEAGGGMTGDDWLAVLDDLGYAVALRRRVRHYPAINTARAPWPPEPFGDAHLCEVLPRESARGSHMVVLLADGRVLDPARKRAKRLADYATVYWVAAVVPCRAQEVDDG